MKKIIALITTVIIALVWFISIIGIGPVGPIKDYIKLGLDISGGVYVVMEADTNLKGEQLTKLMDQTKAVIEERVNEMGLSEPVVTIEGDNRIRVELPGAEDPEAAIEMIGKTAQLQFVSADGTPILDGSQVADSGVEQDQEHGGYAITLKFNSEGADAFAEGTRKAAAGEIKEPFMEGIESGNQIAIVLDNAIISAPSADQEITGGDAIITGGAGGFSKDEAIETSMLIRAGALPVELHEVESSAIGATLGIGALKSSVMAGIIGIGLVLLLMLSIYRMMGLGSSLALLLYVPVVLWILIALQGVLTLPGIAGIILSVGMAVDANVIIFARVKEEVTLGKTLRVAVQTGFKKAMGTIIDSQVTTIIAALVLYMFGTGPVKGFALTLMIGIIVGMFTALFITNIYVRVFTESEFLVKHKLLGVHEDLAHNDGSQGTRLKKQFNFVQHRKIYYIITIAILVVGIGTGLFRGFNTGIDFKGGTMLQIDLGKEVSVQDIQDTLAKDDIKDADVVHFGDKNDGVIIKTQKALTKDDRNSVMKNFEKDYGVKDDALQTFEQFGPSIGKMLEQNAVKSILLAALFMLIYISIRFKWKFGVAAIIATFHDVAIMIALYGLFHMTINNPFIAAILTVVGYSINDTIVVFDRIRENMKGMKRIPHGELIDLSINQTLVRSIMTSLTTILAIIPLIILGGDTVRQFTVPLFIGITAGTLSSIFIASSVFFDLTKNVGKKKIGGGGKQIASSDSSKKAKHAAGQAKKSKSQRSKDNNGAVV
ncbi:MAG: protein translocase subunit SecD [Clostridiales Family XIII bacterium]|jgi:SecD/SecF fusion protein|nr:protein translocase subunit SecD [Clostridiales Family XIII bacterium]